MKKLLTILLMFIVPLLLAFALGAALLGSKPSARYQSAREAQRLEMSERLNTFCTGLMVIALLGTVGLTATMVRLVWLRSQLIHTDDGIFPVVRGHLGGRAFFHDPNRQLAGAVAYKAGPDGVEAHHLMPLNDQDEPFGFPFDSAQGRVQDRQLQVTTQAQAAQVVAAAGQGGRMSPSARRVVQRMTQPRPVTRLPEVVVIDTEIPEERRLLAAIRATIETDEGSL